ncbi:hypothetical protein [Paenibacillus sp. GCM10027626]|uniref:hypothetical protein n=1 Tax=Paenibacillus sp. GCM10027626 TaxID=3273411 RepID=UPI0036292A61
MIDDGHNVDVMITRDEVNKDTVYELALPWSELNPLNQGTPQFIISFLINDNDGAGRKGWSSGERASAETKTRRRSKPSYWPKRKSDDHPSPTDSQVDTMMLHQGKV